MPQGMIKFYNAEKGFGFIAYEHGNDIFFYVSQCGIEKPESLSVGQAVNFEIVKGKKRMDARQLTINPNPPSDLAEKLAIKMKERPMKPRQSNVGDQYMSKQMNFQTPMVFVSYTESIRCTVKRILKYNIFLLCGEDARQIRKLDIKYCYKQEYEASVKANIKYDESIQSQSLEPIEPMNERYQINGKLLQKARSDQSCVKVVLRGGEIIEGTIDWFSPYEIKLAFPEGSNHRPKGNIIAFRHSVYAFAVLDGQEAEATEHPPKVEHEDKPKEAPQKVGSEKPEEAAKTAEVEPEKPTEHIIEVSITSEQALTGTRVRINLPNVVKGSLRLPAGIRDGKRFRLRKHNVLVLVSVK